MLMVLFFCCNAEEKDSAYSFSHNQNSSEEESEQESEEGFEEDRPLDNVPATVLGTPDVGNGEQIFFNSCTACHPQYATPFELLIPEVTDYEIEQAIRDGKKGVPMALGERAPPDGALRLNLTDQDIIDVISYVRELYGPYVP